MGMRRRTIGVFLVAGLILSPWGMGAVRAEEPAGESAVEAVEVVEVTEEVERVDDAPAPVEADSGNGADVDGGDVAAPEEAGADALIRYPGVEIDRAAGEVRVEAKLSPDLHFRPTMLEFILIRGISRAYESAFITDAKPSHIHLGLLLLGLKPGPMPEPEPEGLRSRPLERPAGEVEEEEEQAETAALVDILVRWTEDDGTAMESRVEDFIFARETGARPAPIPFAFTGSYFVRGADGEMQLAADETDAVVAMLYDPNAALNLPYYEGSPYAEDYRAGFAIQTESVPPSFLGEIEIHVIGMQPLPRSERPVQIVFRPATVAVTLPDRFRRDREEADGAAEESAPEANPDADTDAEVNASDAE